MKFSTDTKKPWSRYCLSFFKYSRLRRENSCEAENDLKTTGLNAGGFWVVAEECLIRS